MRTGVGKLPGRDFTPITYDQMNEKKPDKNTAGPEFELAVCAIFQNEARYLAEWIEFHRLNGVEHFVLYNNRSNDDCLAVLQPYCSAGLVTMIHWPNSFEETAQVKAYNDCIERFGSKFRWVALIDIDEFLFSPGGDSLVHVLQEFEEFPGVVANWQVYGSSGRKRRPDGLVIENFLHRAPTQWVRNQKTKSIVNPARVARVLNPHFTEYQLGEVAVNENSDRCELKLRDRGGSTRLSRFIRLWQNRIGRRLVNIYPRIPFDPFLWTTHSLKQVSVERLRINHYAIKSAEEFEEKKMRRRIPGKPGSGIRVHNDIRFKYHDRNDIADPILEKFAPAVLDAIAQTRERWGN